MFHIEKMTVILLTTLLLMLSFTNLSQQFEWNILGTKCEDFPAKIESCWVEKYEVPTCDGKDSLLECAEDAQNDVRHCKEEIRDDINSKYALIKAIRDAICEDTDLRDEFVKKPACWHSARTCASSISALSDDKDIEEDVCSELLESIESCNLLSASEKCQEIQQNFTLEVFEASACVIHAEKLFGLEDAAPIATCSVIVVFLSFILATAIY